jgi:hypothetical protein
MDNRWCFFFSFILFVHYLIGFCIEKGGWVRSEHMSLFGSASCVCCVQVTWRASSLVLAACIFKKSWLVGWLGDTSRNEMR